MRSERPARRRRVTPRAASTAAVVLAVPLTMLAVSAWPSEAATTPVAGGVYTLASGASGKCVDVTAASTSSSALLIQETCSDIARMQWSFNSVSGATSAPTSGGRTWSNVADGFSSYGNYSRGATKMVLENSYFENVNNPYYYEAGTGAQLRQSGSILVNCTGSHTTNGSAFNRAASTRTSSTRPPTCPASSRSTPARKATSACSTTRAKRARRPPGRRALSSSVRTNLTRALRPARRTSAPVMLPIFHALVGGVLRS
ncbi:RICIN domain-containing protein [Dactylosporangium salmoneum]|uniref:Ricin B lectin domain-containing protein n=1 Tax=Dactylosporangium salmoneum TaxID=53361 RepID=A0ABP5TAZ0_9ACTN